MAAGRRVDGRSAIIARHDDRNRALGADGRRSRRIRRLGEPRRRRWRQSVVVRRWRAAGLCGDPVDDHLELVCACLDISRAATAARAHRDCGERAPVLDRASRDCPVRPTDGALPLADPRSGAGARAGAGPAAARRALQRGGLAGAACGPRCAGDRTGVHAVVRPAAGVDRRLRGPGRSEGRGDSPGHGRRARRHRRPQHGRDRRPRVSAAPWRGQDRDVDDTGRAAPRQRARVALPRDLPRPDPAAAVPGSRSSIVPRARHRRSGWCRSGHGTTRWWRRRRARGWRAPRTSS